MSADISQDILDSVDITNISQLILRERESRDLADWDELLNSYHPDSTVHISWFNGSGPDFVKGSIDMHKRGVLAKHRLAPIRVTLNGKRALVSVVGIIDIPTVIDGVQLILSAYGRFLYRVEKRDGNWRISNFECIYHRDEFVPVILGQSLTINPEEVKPFRSSYRNLSYSLWKEGYQVNSELPGEDRPDIVAKLLAERERWLAESGSKT